MQLTFVTQLSSWTRFRIRFCSHPARLRLDVHSSIASLIWRSCPY